MQKLNINIHYEGTTKVNSNNMLLQLLPLHTARNTISYLQSEKSSLSSLQMWPANSPDLKLVD